jgi:hypothetical protein
VSNTILAEPCRTRSSAYDPRRRSSGTCLLFRQLGVTTQHVASALFADFPARVARYVSAPGWTSLTREPDAQAAAVTSFRRRDRPHWLQPQGSSQRLVIVDHGRFITAIEHVGLRP